MFSFYDCLAGEIVLRWGRISAETSILGVSWGCFDIQPRGAPGYAHRNMSKKSSFLPQDELLQTSLRGAEPLVQGYQYIYI